MKNIQLPHHAPGSTRAVLLLVAGLMSILLPALWYVTTYVKPPAQHGSGSPTEDEVQTPLQQGDPVGVQQSNEWKQNQDNYWVDQQQPPGNQQQEQYQQYEADHRAWEQEQVRRQFEQDNLRIQEESRRMQEQQRLYQQQQEQQRQLQQRGY